MENVEKLAAALVKAQAKMMIAKKETENTSFKSKYADLGSVWSACHSVLSENDIAVVQSPVFMDVKFFLRTTLLHSSGQSISGDYLIKPTKEDPQAYGSAYTYARRYSLAAMVGVISEDDDGNLASTPAETKPEHQKPVPAAKKNDGKTLISNPFVITKLSDKTGETNGKPWAKVSCQDEAGAWYTTFDEKIAGDLKSAKKSGVQVVLDYQTKGDWNTIIKVEVYTEAPF